jgi:hypothetical protein
MEPGSQAEACTADSVENQIIRDNNGERIPINSETERWIIPGSPRITSVPRTHRTPAELHRLYSRWCELNGDRPVGPSVFSSVLASLGIERVRAAGYRFFIMPKASELDFTKALN